ncbi:MAG: DUF1080 domain-containing protein [Verrucomicrobiota bacterium]|jgi:hypothetical protein
MKLYKKTLKTGYATCSALGVLLAVGFLGAPVLGQTNDLQLPDFLGFATNGSGVYGRIHPTKVAWSEWGLNDPNRPAPKRVDPGPAGPPAPVPADAIVLFDGKDLNQWQPTDSTNFTIEDGCLVAAVKSKVNLLTKQEFGSAQIHLEWMDPADFHTQWDDRGNNGVLLLGAYEIQIFDSYNEKIYPDGQCASVYDETPPLVNVTRPPGQWQTYDIFFTAPEFDNGKVVKPGRVTMLHNGVLVQLDTEIHSQRKPRSVPSEGRLTGKGPLGLAPHDCPVRFRNIWVRPL